MIKKINFFLSITFFLALSPNNQDINNFPNETSCCIADLKFGNNHVQLCEFGEFIEAKFLGHGQLFGNGAMWQKFWKHLGSFNCPIWYVDTRLWKKNNQEEYAYDDFVALGGGTVSTLQELEKDPSFKLAAKASLEKSGSFCAGIIVFRSMAIHSSVIRTFKSKHPKFIILGDATNDFVRSKQETSKLFDNQESTFYKPKFKLYHRKYTDLLSQEIIRDLGGEHFVIKPVNAALGHGIIIVNQADLESTLQLILRDTEKLSGFLHDKSYHHWRREKSAYFIVESFAQSKTIMVNNKPYDATMRVTFSLTNNNGQIYVIFFDAYWKLPLKSLDQDGTLNEKHKSQISTNRLSSAQVDPEDFERVKTVMHQFLPELYLKMLTKRYKAF